MAEFKVTWDGDIAVVVDPETEMATQGATESEAWAAMSHALRMQLTHLNTRHLLLLSDYGAQANQIRDLRKAIREVIYLPEDGEVAAACECPQCIALKDVYLETDPERKATPCESSR